MTLTSEQNDRLILTVAQVEQLMTEVDEQGAEAMLDELYLLITKLLERFPNLDNDDD
ncbi:MAG TPA: hypothetical protein V6D34_10685 [Candidatus Sericytochromatia bacterium]